MLENTFLNVLLPLPRKTTTSAFKLLTNDLPEPAAPNPQGCCPHVRHIETAEIWRTGHLLDPSLLVTDSHTHPYTHGKMSHFEPNAILRGAQLTVVGALRALKNPGLFTSEHYKQAALAVLAGIVIRVLVAIPVCL